MAIEHKLTRYEKNRDKDGSITSIFIAVSVTDGTYGLNQEHWLSSDEMAAVIADESAINTIIEQAAIDGEYKLEQENLNRPLPPIIATEEQKEAIVISKEKVSEGVISLKADLAKKVEEVESKVM